MKKIIAAALMVGACIGMAACSGSGSSGFEPTEQDKRVVMTVGDSDVEYQEYRYYFLNNKRDLYGADAVLTQEQLDEIISLTEENARHRHTLAVMADKYDARLTTAELAEADAYVDEYRTAYFTSDDEYLLALDENYMTDYLFRRLTEESTLMYAVLNQMKESGAIRTDDASIDAFMASDELVCIKEIYIPYGSEEEKETSGKRAEEALDKLMNGEDFEELMREYSSYSTNEVPPEHGYYTMQYDAPDIIWETAIGLAVGEHSYVVESNYGFHIIMRCEKDAEYMEKIRDEIVENYGYAKFSEEYETIMDTLEIEYTDYGASLDLGAIS